MFLRLVVFLVFALGTILAPCQVQQVARPPELGSSHPRVDHFPYSTHSSKVLPAKVMSMDATWLLKLDSPKDNTTGSPRFLKNCCATKWRFSP